MKARYQYRFYPTDQQQQSLAQLFGCVRVVWNDALAICKQVEKLPSNNDLQKIVITQAKKTIERKWLSEVSNIPLQQSVADLGIAYKNFFDSLKGKRKGKKVGRPKFKKKTNQQSARFRIGGFSFQGKQVYLAKIGNVSPVWSRELPSSPSSVTVIKDCANRYFLSFVVEIEPASIDAKNQSIGIDLGIKTFAVMSDGTKAESPNYSNKNRKIRKLQKKLARQPKESKRRSITRIRIAKLHNQIADTRKDFLHKLSTKVVSENQAIVLEDLNVSGMVKNRKLSRAISLQGWREFRTLCEGKSEKLDRVFHVISRWEPTSQVCSDCGYKWGKLDLKVRLVKCLDCGSEHDRDENAAKNINKVGIGHCHDSKRTQRNCKTTTVTQNPLKRQESPLVHDGEYVNVFAGAMVWLHQVRGLFLWAIASSFVCPQVMLTEADKPFEFSLVERLYSEYFLELYMFDLKSVVSGSVSEPLLGGVSPIAQSGAFVSDPLASVLARPVSSGTIKELAFVDAGLADVQTLVSGLKPDTAVYLLNPGGDELNQISQVLAGYSNLSSVSLFSHGSDGALQLGNTQLNSDNLINYAGVLQSWSKSLVAGADVLLYGCDVAGDAIGQSFVSQIAALTKADVAASSDRTGSHALGGDWELEFSTGSIEASNPLSDWAQTAYQNVLATFTVTNTADSGTDSLRDAINKANASAGADRLHHA